MLAAAGLASESKKLTVISQSGSVGIDSGDSGDKDGIPESASIVDLGGRNIEGASELGTHAVEAVVGSNTLTEDVSVPLEISIHRLSSWNNPGSKVVELIKKDCWDGDQPSKVGIGMELFVPEFVKPRENRGNVSHPGVGSIVGAESLEEGHERARYHTVLKTDEAVELADNRGGLARSAGVLLNN